jgi:hypothetical protein
MAWRMALERLVGEAAALATHSRISTRRDTKRPAAAPPRQAPERVAQAQGVKPSGSWVLDREAPPRCLDDRRRSD